MGKYLDKLKRLQPEQRTDKTDMPPETVSVSGMSVPFPESARENSSPTAEPVVVEPAHPNARPVYWARNDGRIYGPATVTDLARVGTGATEQFWVVIEYHGQPAWVRSDRLRSQQQCEHQITPKPFERIKEPR